MPILLKQEGTGVWRPGEDLSASELGAEHRLAPWLTALCSLTNCPDSSRQSRDICLPGSSAGPQGHLPPPLLETVAIPANQVEDLCLSYVGASGQMEPSLLLEGRAATLRQGHLRCSTSPALWDGGPHASRWDLAGSSLAVVVMLGFPVGSFCAVIEIKLPPYASCVIAMQYLFCLGMGNERKFGEISHPPTGLSEDCLMLRDLSIEEHRWSQDVISLHLASISRWKQVTSYDWVLRWPLIAAGGRGRPFLCHVCIYIEITGMCIRHVCARTHTCTHTEFPSRILMVLWAGEQLSVG